MVRVCREEMIEALFESDAQWSGYGWCSGWRVVHHEVARFSNNGGDVCCGVAAGDLSRSWYGGGREMLRVARLERKG